MHIRMGKRAWRAVTCSVSLLLLAVPALAQPMQQTPPPTSTPPVAATPPPSPGGAPPALAMDSFLPALPSSVVPPRIAAPYPCRFPHSVAYAHPTGPAVVTFTVTAQGRVTNASVAQSSGSGVVDEAVRDCVSGFIYAPAMRDGAPIDISWAYQYNLTITRSRLPPAAPPDAPVGTKFVMMPVQQYRSSVGDCERWHGDAAHSVLVAFDVEPDGSVKNASVAGTGGDATIDRDAVDCVSKRAYKPATRDGKPVEIRLTAEMFGPNRE